MDARIVAGLRWRCLDVVTASDQGLLGAADVDHLARAMALGRVTVSADHDFLRLAQERSEAGVAFAGLIFILPWTRVGEAVRAIALVADVLDPEDLADWIEWVP